MYFRVVDLFIPIWQVKLWKIPERGLHSNLTEWLVDLHGHQRKVGYLEWHPTAENILLSAGFDFKVSHLAPVRIIVASSWTCIMILLSLQCILWNTETAEPISIIDVHHDTIFSIAWNREGSLFATTCKDKKLRIIDPREGHVVAVSIFMICFIMSTWNFPLIPLHYPSRKHKVTWGRKPPRWSSSQGLDCSPQAFHEWMNGSMPSGIW